MKKFFPYVLAFILLSAPTALFAAGLVTCGGTGEPQCDFSQVIIMINKIIRFLIFDISMPVLAIMFAYSGVLFMTSGENPKNRDKAKSMIKKALIGLVIAMSAWLIVVTILQGLGLKDAFKDFLTF
ncbi:MAG: pilin [Candidatus Paceibacterota bacterium]|jgi:hypothetical protein